MCTDQVIHKDGWRIEVVGQYIHLRRNGKPGALSVKAEDDGFIVDAWSTSNDGPEECVSTMGVEYNDLRGGV